LIRTSARELRVELPRDVSVVAVVAVAVVAVAVVLPLRARGKEVLALDLHDVGVELKGVSWSCKASNAGIESEVWAERDDGKSP
jgi:hypothetical protein